MAGITIACCHVYRLRLVMCWWLAGSRGMKRKHAKSLINGVMVSLYTYLHDSTLHYMYLRRTAKLARQVERYTRKREEA